MGKKKQNALFPEHEDIVSRIRSGEQQDLLVFIVPSHDKAENAISDQEMWASAALNLLGELYGGATAFSTFGGVFQSDDGRLLHDRPILIESYVRREVLVDRDTLTELLRFAKRMGRETKQEAVGVIINSVFHAITDFRDRQP